MKRNTTQSRKIENLVISISCLFTSTTLSATSLKAQPVTPAMTSAEILELVEGNITIGTFSDRPLNYQVLVAADGRLIGRIADGESERIELGSWRVSNNMLCGRWDNLKDGAENCFTYHRVGDNIHAYNADGSLDRIQFFAQGDPYQLQQAATSSKQQKAFDATKVETEVRKFVDNWGQAWSPEDNAAQYTREFLIPFYLQSDELLAFDFTDAESTTVI